LEEISPEGPEKRISSKGKGGEGNYWHSHHRQYHLLKIHGFNLEVGGDKDKSSCQMQALGSWL